MKKDNEGVVPFSVLESRNLLNINELRDFLKKSLKSRSNSMSGKPFKYAKLYDCKGQVGDRNYWYFHFSILDPITKKYKRYFERFDINRIYGATDAESRKLRYNYSKTIIAELNAWLDNGNFNQAIVIKSDEKTLKSGVLLAMKYKENKNLRQRSIQTYQNVADRFITYTEELRVKNFELKDVTKQFMISYRDHLLQSGISNLTVNKYVALLHSIFQELVDREYITINPCTNIKKLEETEGQKNIPLTRSEMDVIMEDLPKEHPRLWMFFMFIWYGMMRGQEICQLTPSMIDWVNGYIHLPGTITKTKLTRVIYLMPEFLQFLKDHEVHQIPAHHFIFSETKSLAPGKNPVLRNRVSEQWKWVVKDKLGIDKDMYAGKHTSAKIFILNGGSKESLQVQMGHTTIATTEVYLKKIMPHESLARFAKEFSKGPLAPKIP